MILNISGSVTMNFGILQGATIIAPWLFVRA
jgi:hypothetical protein